MPDRSRDLDHKVAIVTGSASGIGLAVAKLFAMHGARLVLVDRDATALAPAAAEIAAEGTRVYVGDVGDEVTAREAVNLAISEYGQLDLLINNAGTAFMGTAVQTSIQDWDRVFATNVRSVFLFSREAVRNFRPDSGCAIVNVASEAGLVGFAGYVAYSASKAAVVNLTRSMAVDHAPDGIRVNCVCPGSIETPLLRAYYDAQTDPSGAREADIREHPLGIGKPEDVAEAVLYLASRRAAYVTGHALAVDGGYTAR
jgi:NAD(P)-dependent dehydrogenase (short-subunit alcohol dehydrogenase family)